MFQSVSMRCSDVAPMKCFARALAVIGIALIALPATALTSAAAERWHLSQSADQPTVAAPPGDIEQEAPAITEDGTPATVIDDREVEGILGKSVRSNAGEDMGQIIDVIVKRDGQVRAAVIDFGGFLGVGSRKIAVDWSALSFPASGVIDHVILNLTPRSSQVGPRISTRRTARRARRGGSRSAQAGSLQRKSENSRAGEVTLPAARPLRNYGRPGVDGDEAHAAKGPTKTRAKFKPAAWGHLPRALAPEVCADSIGSSSSSPTRRWASAHWWPSI